MSGREDTRLVDHLYDELSEKEAREYRRALEEDAALADEVGSFEETLGLMRKLEAEEPSAHLDSLILARAREEAEALAEKQRGLGAFLKKIFRSPAIGLAVAGSVVAVAAIVAVPGTMLKRAPEATQAVPIQEQLEEMRAAEGTRAANETPPVIAEPARTENLPEAESERSAVVGDQPEPPKRRAKLAPPAVNKPVQEDSGAEKRDRGADTEFDKKAALDTPKDEAPAEEKATKTPPRKTLSFDDGTADSTLATKESAPAKAEAKKPVTAQSKPAEQPQEAPAVAEPEAAREQVVGGASTGAVGTRGDVQQPRGPAGGKMSPDAAMAYARDLIRAAETQLSAQDKVGARNILVNGLGRTRGTPAYGELALRLAQLDYAERDLIAAANNAKAAASTPGFARRRAAIDLLERVARESGNEADQRWADEASESAVRPAAVEAR